MGKKHLIAAEAEGDQRSLWGEAWRRFKKNRLAMIGMYFILALVIIAIATIIIDAVTGKSIYLNYVVKQDLRGRLQGPSLAHPFGLDEFGRDMLLRMLWAVRYQMQQNGRVTLPACETALDMLYFRSMWKTKDKYLSKNEQKIISQCFGTRMDMLNLQWICRSKKFYRLEPGEIYAMLIPIQLHLTRKEISRMVEAENLDILYGLIEASWYGRTGLVHLDEDQDLDHLAHDIIDRIYLKTSRKDPYSIAILNSYLYFKEREIQRIITTIEKIRYGLGAS